MKSSWTHLGPPVSQDRTITSFPKWYTPDACLQLKEHFHSKVSTACQHRNTGTVGLKLSKVVVVGDLYVGKTSLIHSWDTAGQEKFKCIASAYYRGAQVIITVFDLTDVQTLEHTRQWLEDALRENEAGSCFLFLVGTKKDLLVSRVKLKAQPQGTCQKVLARVCSSLLRSSDQHCHAALCWTSKKAMELKRALKLPCSLPKRDSLKQSLRYRVSQGCFSQSGAACEQVEAEAVHLANELRAEYWSVSAKTGENVKAFFSRVAALAFEQSVLQDLEKRPSTQSQVGDGDGDLIRIEVPKTQENKRPPGLGCC
ncbi:ras-related protein Rab-36 isoform X3 [Mesocricetus auratus]|uniref:Ras-related protein Rab-36 isoform X3 n=1 Tax=Mesocricetus auratus TaxID=10036 RepID=A0ABM2WBF1_MESAU|nr:ras-related protein Rab-36 isoform X3 [Mesocricetus auratus]